MRRYDATNLAVLGDFCLAGDGIRSAFCDQSTTPWAGAINTLGKSTALIANLECAITDHTEGRPLKYANLRAARDLAWMLDGLELAVLGNNHITDFGPTGVADTRSILAERGVSSVGYGEDLSEALGPQFLEITGKQVGVISLCCPTTNGEGLATHSSAGVAPLGMATLREAVRGAKEQCDALLVYLHWGCEHVHDPVPDQMRLARHAIDFGADAVVGCHAHTIQSYECYKGRWIFYGLGNFLFGDTEVQELKPDGTIVPTLHRQAPENRESLAVQFSVVPEQGQGRLKLEKVQFLRLDENYIPRPISEEHLTFDLDAANQRLRTFAQANAEDLAVTHELLLKCQMRNGILAYFYTQQPIKLAPERPWPWKTRIRAAAKALLKGHPLWQPPKPRPWPWRD